MQSIPSYDLFAGLKRDLFAAAASHTGDFSFANLLSGLRGERVARKVRFVVLTVA